MALFGRPSANDEAREQSWRQWLQRQNPLALTSLLLSVFSLTHFGTLFVDEVAGVALGVIALRQLRRARHGGGGAPHWSTKPEGNSLAWAGIVLGCMSFTLACVLYLWPGAVRAA